MQHGGICILPFEVGLGYLIVQVQFGCLLARPGSTKPMLEEKKMQCSVIDAPLRSRFIINSSNHQLHLVISFKNYFRDAITIAVGQDDFKHHFVLMQPHHFFDVSTQYDTKSSQCIHVPDSVCRCRTQQPISLISMAMILAYTLTKV